jgi:hypothetical protein
VARRTEAADVADLSHEDGSHRRTYPLYRLDSPVAAVRPEALSQLALGDVYLVVEDAEQPPERAHPVAVGLGELHLFQEHPAPGPNMSSSAGSTLHLAITAWTCALAEVAKATDFAR